MDCYLSQLLKMVNELSSLESIKTKVDDLGETLSSLSETVSTLNSNMAIFSNLMDDTANVINDLTRRTNYGDYFASSTVVLDTSDNDDKNAYLVNLYEYFNAGYSISQMYVTDKDTTDIQRSYNEGTVVYKDNDTYLKMKPEESAYTGESHYNFIVKLTHEDETRLTGVYVIGRFANRTKCYILTESQYELLDNWEYDNPYKLKYPLTLSP